MKIIQHEYMYGERPTSELCIPTLPTLIKIAFMLPPTLEIIKVRYTSG